MKNLVKTTHLIELLPLEANSETRERRFFEPQKARLAPTTSNNGLILIYEEALRRDQSNDRSNFMAGSKTE